MRPRARPGPGFDPVAAVGIGTDERPAPAFSGWFFRIAPQEVKHGRGIAHLDIGLFPDQQIAQGAVGFHAAGQELAIAEVALLRTVQRLFTLRLRTHNPFHLFLMAVFGTLGLGLSAALFNIGLLMNLEPGAQALIFLAALAALIFSLALLANLAFSETRHHA